MVEKTTTTCMTQPLRTNKQISNNNNEDPLSSHIETSKRTGSLASSSYSTCPDSEESPPSSAPHSPLNTSARENTPAAAPEVEDEEEGFSKQEEEENREEDLPSTISPPPSPPFAEGEKEFTPAASDNEATPVPLPPDDEGAAEDCKEIPSPEGKDAEEIPNMSPNSSRPDPVATPSTEQLPQSKCHALSPDNLSPNFQEFMSLLKVDDPDNARDDDNAAASSGDDLVEPADKGDLKEEGADATTPNDNDVAVVNESNTEISGSPSHPPVASPADNNLDVTPNYNVLQYSYVHRHAPALADFTKVSNSKSTLGKRCYRLNLERPFDIHCEQSPLEYGNYMAPWTKEVQPSTVGPTEYCPPRHLGGEEAVWRELMRWSHGSGSVRNEDVVADAIEDKTGSAGEVYESGVTSSYTSGIGGSGWRKLQPKEFLAVKKLREYNNEGELTFQTYDLSHAVLDKDGLDAHNATVMRDTTTLGEGGIQSAPPPSIHTIFSVDSNTSAEERLNRKSPEETADATSRLFRRSEISLQEAAEKEEEARMLKTQQEEEEKRLVKERQKLERGSSRRGSLKLGKSFKKMVRKMSSSGSSSQSSRNLSQKAVVGKAANAALMRRCSVQASQIDKARDMVDGCDDGEGGLIITPGDGQTAGKSSDLIDAVQKKQIISLFIVGEYDVLNDLVNNGAKRLSDSKDSSDLDVLLQNDRCPTPDRWVRSTGWGKCNPSSNYARNPPEDFDWEKYDDKLWLITDDPKKAEPISDVSSLYTRRNYAKKLSSTEEEVEDTLSQSQRTRRTRRRGVGAAKAGAGAPAAAKQAPAPEEEDTLSQSQRVRKTRRRVPAKK